MALKNLATLGWFVFNLRTVPFEKIAQQNTYKWAENTRFGQEAGAQFIGIGTESRTLSGTLAPELTGGPSGLDTLNEMAATGKCWHFLEGTGVSQGYWYITGVSRDSKHLIDDGRAQVIGFSVELKKYPEARPNSQDIGPLKMSKNTA